MTTLPPETHVPWAPNMVYRACRHKTLPRTLCEQFIEEQVVTFFRTYMPLGGPNFDYSTVMQRATKFVTYIDLLRDNKDFRTALLFMLQNKTTPNALVATVFHDRDLASLLTHLSSVQQTTNLLAASRADKLSFYVRDPSTLDQLIWAITHPREAHPVILPDTDDPFFIAVLLIRHFKYYGGLVLPPLQAARVKQAVHEALVRSEKEKGNRIDGLFMYYPSWRDSQGVEGPPGFVRPVGVGEDHGDTTVTQIGWEVVAGSSPFGAVGDWRFGQ